VTAINNTTSRSELVDRCVRVELIAAKALTCSGYDGPLGAAQMARDILAALRGLTVRGNVTVTHTGLPPT
jgi:hypothetical protein